MNTIYGVYIPDTLGNMILVSLHERKDGEDPSSATAAAKLYGGVALPVKVLR